MWNQKEDILYVCRGPSFSDKETLDIYRIPNVSTARQHAEQLTDGSNNAFPSTNKDGR